ncbi:MAG TPA: hypothetical protein VFF13_02665 [archaeon]|nr:hypothetical protein [archaeon]
MNLPVGEVISQGVNFREIDSQRLVESFFDKKFSGYIVMTLQGFNGLEEGILLFKEGFLVGSIYEYDLQGLTVFGDSSIEHVFNAFAAEYVSADIVSLSNQQVDLVTAFNDKAKLHKVISKKDIGRSIPKVFSPQQAELVLKDFLGKKDSKKDIFKKLGLSSLGD